MPKQRDIVLVPIPFTNLQSSKKRPVLILSNNEYNDQYQDVIVAAITSNIEQKNKFSLLIESTDIEEGILPRTSQIRVDKVYCLHQKLILKKYGRIKVEAYQKVTDTLAKLVNPA